MNLNDLFKPGQKKIWFLAGAALLGIVLMLWGGSGAGGRKIETGKPPAEAIALSSQASTSFPAAGVIMTAEEKTIAAGLQQMLEQVAGAGKVEVTVRLATSTHSDFAVNSDTSVKTTVEEDQNGGTRKITENTGASTVVVTGEGQGQGAPVISREIAPEVAGVLVVAEGAGEPLVKAELFRAVQVGLGVQPQKIMVLNMKRGD
ncbi:MAG: hypothetical protein FWC60_05825 [Firmicutes bacterium]|nr:hypothetical protein [Bacillota bacterium]